MTKKELRGLYREKRLALPEKERVRLDDLLLIQFQQLPIHPDTNILLTYWPLQQHAEVNVHLMADYMSFRIPGLQLAFPLADFSNQTMKAVLVNDDTNFQLNEYGIAEPTDGEEIAPDEIDMIFVPLLAFDKKGYRVGYGKGFYDRYLAGCRKDAVLAGFSFFGPVDAISDINQFDVPLTIGITPNTIYEF